MASSKRVVSKVDWQNIE